MTFLTSHREGVEVLMADLQIPTEEISYGRSKIFIRNPRTVKSTLSPGEAFIFWTAARYSCRLGCFGVERLKPVCSAALLSHSYMFVKQGGLCLEPPLQQLACNHHSENTWFHLAVPYNMGNRLLSSALADSSAARACSVWMDFLPHQQKAKQSLE